jgi:restriction endonuclease S subunit
MTPVTLGDVVRIDARIVDPTEPSLATLPHVSAENIRPVTGDLLNIRSAAEDRMESGKYLFDAGDVLYSKLRPYLRKAAIPAFPGLCSADMYPLKIDRRRVSAEYLRALLVSDRFTAYSLEESARSRMPKLNREQLFAYQFYLPSIDEQIYVASRLKKQLSALDEARSAAISMATEADALWVATYRAAFGDVVVPVAVPPQLDHPPEGWRWRKLTDVARLESGHTPSRSRPDWWGGEVSWISLTEIRALDGRWVDSTRLRTNELGLANSAARILPRGTVCYSRTASVGFVTIMREPMATSQDFANWVCGSDLDPEFLMHALIRSRKELRELAAGATHKTIYMPTLETFHVCAPPRAEQEHIVRRLKTQLDRANQARAAVQTQLADIRALPSQLLAQAFEEHHA